MADGNKLMRWSLPEGGYVHLEWPASISLESLEMVEQVLALQLRSVRRSIEQKKGVETESAAAPSPAPQGEQA